jgi:hypothetical protein
LSRTAAPVGEFGSALAAESRRQKTGTEWWQAGSPGQSENKFFEDFQ